MAKFISKFIPAGDNVDVYYLKDKIVRDSIGVASGTSIGTGVTSLGIASLNNNGKVNNTQLPISTTNPSSSSDDTTLPTSKAVWGAISDGIATNDAMIYKGTIAGGSIDSYGALTAAANRGWTYKVTTAGKIDGIAVEVGDMIICNTDNTAAATSSNYTTIAAKWDFIQANIDGAVTGPASSTTNNVAVYDSSTGKVIKDSGLSVQVTETPSGSDTIKVFTFS